MGGGGSGYLNPGFCTSSVPTTCGQANIAGQRLKGGTPAIVGEFDAPSMIEICPPSRFALIFALQFIIYQGYTDGGFGGGGAGGQYGAGGGGGFSGGYF